MSQPGSRAALVLLALLAAAGCGRSPLWDVDLPAHGAVTADAAVDRGTDRASDPPEERRDVVPDLAAERPPEAGAVDLPPACRPQVETCNGIDDDCDGTVDEDQAPIPCPAGGARYCVAGRFSECPRRCDVCVPGSKRICFVSFCTFWGVQTCAADGRSFGPCTELAPPAECESVATARHKSAELEMCCLDNDYCCRDEFDLDHDGDRNDMLGRCEAVVCGP